MHRKNGPIPRPKKDRTPHPLAALLESSRESKLPMHEWRLVFGDKPRTFRTSHFRRWQLQEAKAKFSSLFDRVFSEGPQLVTRRDKEAVVVLSHEQYKKLAGGEPTPQPGMLETLAKCPAGPDLNVPNRDPSDNVLNLPPVFE